MIDVHDLPRMFSDFRVRWVERDARMLVMDKVVRGDTTVYDPDNDPVDVRSANMIQVALEDTAEAGSILPTVRARPNRPGPQARAKGAKMEKIGMGYLDNSDWERLVHESHLDWLAFGFCPWVIWPDFETNMPILEKRDPRYFYPEPGYRPGQEVRRALFARTIYFSQLPAREKGLIEVGLGPLRVDWTNLQVTVVEYFDEHEVVVAGLVNTSPNTYLSGKDALTSMTPVEFDRIENKAGVCQVVVDDKISLDGEPRGQFDQVVPVLEAHMRLMGLVLDYADQAVYSDVWVKDLIGPMPYGGGAYIELGPNGQIGRLAPAVSSLDVQRDLERLEEGIHLAARWPKNRPGDVDQAIASAKFVEATAGIMNTAVRTMHQSFSRALARALRVMYVTDKKVLGGGQKTTTGVLRNQEFVEDYDVSDIDLDVKVIVDFGTGLGRDVAQSAVLGIQLGQAELMSKESVMEATEGITDVQKEMIRLDVEKFRTILLGQILQQAEGGMLPPDALPQIMRARLDGKDLAEIYDEFVVRPKEEALAGATQTGLGAGPIGPDGQPLPPGLGGGPDGAAPPGVPAAPNPVEMLARLGGPGGPGGTIGTQVQG